MLLSDRVVLITQAYSLRMPKRHLMTFAWCDNDSHIHKGRTKLDRHTELYSAFRGSSLIPSWQVAISLQYFSM